MYIIYFIHSSPIALMTAEMENEETAWLYYLPAMTEEEEQEADIYFNAGVEEMLNSEQEANSSDESFSDLPPPLRLGDLFDAAAVTTHNNRRNENENGDDDNFIPFIQPQLNITYVPFVQKANGGGDDDNDDKDCCLICFESCPRKNLVHFKEKWMVERRCCMRNYMCEDCFVNTIRYKPNQIVCCPFCRHPISHIETHNPDFHQRVGEYLQLG